mmetsp:Transcript_21549/g.36979  ORF Transcript_21549/g.36979 Transcript_21549/m.36979 type:complete len:204 (+) Transcript_21549:167-778(+)
MSLLSGYSMMPSAPAAFSFGISARTSCSSRIVSTAHQPSSESGDTVGFLSDGSVDKTSGSWTWRQFILRPTLLSAAMAPWRSMTSCSIFSRFHGSAYAVLFAISCVVDSHTVSMMVSLFARRLRPVSVSSMMASTSPALTLTSVAPQLNSTSTSTTPLRWKYCVATATTSLATRFPASCFGDVMPDPSGTASTHRTLFSDCFE